MGLAPHVVRRALHVGVFVVFAVTAAFNAGPRATRAMRAGMTSGAPFEFRGQGGPVAGDARWVTVRAALGAGGVEDGGTLRVDLARPDLRVRVGEDVLATRL